MEELSEEIALVQQVYDASLPYNDWLAFGRPITFDVPSEQAPVVSGVRLGNRVLVRRTDFGGVSAPVTILVDRKALRVPSARGQCQILSLE